MGIPPEQGNHENLLPEQVTQRRTRTRPPGSQRECESETNYPPSSQVTLLTKKVRGWEPKGCRAQAWVIPFLPLESSF